jgi:hypothetical protein
MKKLLLVLAIIFNLNISWANVFVPPGAQISELLWDENGDWQLEISYYYFSDGEITYDSVVISTREHRYLLTLPVTENFEQGIFILNKQQCADSFDINLLGDSIFIKTYDNDYHYYSPEEHSLIFGDFPNSTIPKPNTGSSIALVEGLNRWFVMDASPTLGQANTLEGCTGTIKGTVYNAKNETVNLMNRFALNFDFRTTETGSYSSNLTNGNHKLTYIAYDVSGEDYFEWFTIEPIEITIEPDYVYENLGIHITDPNFLGIHKEPENHPLKIYPNPAYQKLNIEMFLPLEGQNMEILVLDMSGKEVARFMKSFAKNMELEWNEHFPGGMYLFGFWTNNTLIQTEHVLINPFK